MIKSSIIPIHPLKKAAYLVLLCFLQFSSNHIYAQKKAVVKIKVLQKSSKKRIIYGMASFYANKFHGRQTANGEIFSQDKFTCACNMLPFGTWVRVTNIRNGKTVEVKVNDRLHPRMRRVADLSKIAAKKLGYTAGGIVRVKVEVIGKRRV